MSGETIISQPTTSIYAEPEPCYFCDKPLELVADDRLDDGTIVGRLIGGDRCHVCRENFCTPHIIQISVRSFDAKRFPNQWFDEPQPHCIDCATAVRIDQARKHLTTAADCFRTGTPKMGRTALDEGIRLLQVAVEGAA